MSDSDFDSGESELSENFSDPETSDSERGPRPSAELHGSPSKEKQEKISASVRQEKQQQPSLNKDRRKKREKLKIGEEVRALTDLESDVATLQIKEILKEITLKEKKRQALLAWFSQIKALLLAATGGGQDSGKKHQPPTKKKKRAHEPSEAVATSQHFRVPVPIEGCFAPEPQLAEEFVFQPPKSVRLVGSFAYGTAVKWSTLDVSVEMPKECFARGDYHNLKYHHKRAIYLTHLVAALQKSSVQQQQVYSKLQWRVNGDYRLPELVVTSGDGSFSARILPFPEEGLFQNSRFAPDKLNIQEKFIGMPPDSRKPVPIYNGGVLQDMLLASTAEKLSKQLSSSSGVREGIQVLKLWLRTRGLSEGPDGFSSFLLTIYASHLLKTDRLNSMMGAYQVVRAILAQIQADDWTAATPTTQSDESGCHNYFYRLSSSSRSLLKEEARAALHTVNSGSVTLINELFSTKISFYRKLDCYARISLGNAGSQTKERAPANRLDKWTRADFGGSVLWPSTEAVLSTLRRAFGRRVSLLASKSLESAQWDIGGRIPQEPQEFEIGWNLNPDESHHHIDKGPPADSSEAEEFRSFWGEKCEIRRFQDGSILETVVWPDDNDDHRKVVQHICEYILLRQHDISRISFSGEVCDRVLELPKCHFSQRYGIGQDQLFDINTKFNEFARMLRSLKDLPLSITSVQGVSDEIAYTSVFPQAAASCDTDARLITRVDGRCVPKPAADQGVPKLVKPVDILLVMESSSKWPDELGAIRHIKTAFYLALATKLEGRECQVFPDHLLVLFQGLVFRLRISCPKEILLSRQEVLRSQTENNNKISQRLEFENTVLPQLISALHGLQLQHPTFGTTSRIAKRWLSCHLLYDAFPSLAVDLIVASLYLSPLPLSCEPPHSSRAAFQRFLHLMSTLDWRLNPLIVNINNQFSQEDIQQINSHFTRQRQSLPPMYIRTPFDKTSSISLDETSFVTSEKPMGLALHRAAKLAGKCLAALELQMAAGQGVLGIFRTSLEVFDFVIKLDPRFVATSHLALNSQEKLSFTKIRDEIPVVDFDPVSIYVSELREAFGHLCVFFYDGFGGTDIGGLWIPKAQIPLPFKVRNVNARKLIEPAKVLVPNYSAIFADFKTLGLGLVKEVVEQRCPNNYSNDSRASSHLGSHKK